MRWLPCYMFSSSTSSNEKTSDGVKAEQDVNDSVPPLAETTQPDIHGTHPEHLVALRRLKVS